MSNTTQNINPLYSIKLCKKKLLQQKKSMLLFNPQGLFELKSLAGINSHSSIKPVIRPPIIKFSLSEY